jgi:hypothetical protein
MLESFLMSTITYVFCTLVHIISLTEVKVEENDDAILKQNQAVSNTFFQNYNSVHSKVLRITF